MFDTSIGTIGGCTEEADLGPECPERLRAATFAELVGGTAMRAALGGGVERLPQATSTILPGGASVEEAWFSPNAVGLRLTGELDLLDKHALVDTLASCVAAGAHDIVVDASALTFIDMASLRAFDRVRRFLHRMQGSVRVTGLRFPLAQAWAALSGQSFDEVGAPLHAA